MDKNIENWKNFGDSVNNAFFFVVDKIISIQGYFIDTAYSIARVVLLIALLSAALNYALTGQGFKENMIKIMKATLFFLIVTAAYPLIIGWITRNAFEIAYASTGKDVEKYFEKKLYTMDKKILDYSGKTETHSSGSMANSDGNTFGEYDENSGYYTYTRDLYETVITLTGSFYKDTPELKAVFSDIMKTSGVNVKGTLLSYTAFAPASVMQLLLMTASSAFTYAEKKNQYTNLPDFNATLKGLIAGLFLLVTGTFALIEYLVCFLEFMFVASVGIILFPMSIWEGSKFLTEGFIKAIVGFFMKLLFCNIAIFLLLYGFVSIFHIFGVQQFSGSVDQFAFIIFSCLLFFFICKSAPGLAQSLLSGAPSLNAAGAIGAVAGVAATAAAAAGFVKSKVNSAKNAGASLIGGGAKLAGSLIEAGNASKAAKEDGGNRADQAGAFMSSLGKNASQSLSRSIYGGQSGGQTMGEMNDSRRQAGTDTGKQHMNSVRSKL